MIRILALVTGALLVAASAAAQSASIITNEIKTLADAATAARADAVAAVVDAAIKVKLAADGKKANQDFLAFRRADVQTGSGSGGTGTTSAVASPLLPAIFGMAFESGALTRTVSGNTVTLKVSPAGLACASGPHPAAVAARDPKACRTFWNRFGVTAAFDTSRDDNDSPALDNLQTAKRQFAELGVRAEVVNKRQPRAYQEFAEKAQDFVNRSAAFAAITDPWRDKATDALNGLFKAADWNGLAADKRAERIAKVIDGLVPELPDPPAGARDAWLAALKAEQRADFNRTVVTLEYTFQQPDLALEAIGDPVVVPAGARPPGVHTGRLIVAKGIGNRNVDFTFNLSVSLFQEAREGMPGRLRDVRSGLELKFRMRDIRNYGAPTLSFAGLYMFLNQEPIGLGLVAFNSAKIEERGHLGLFQAKLEFPTANNAVRIPISISASNRTELLKESDVRGQIGISMNLDALFGAPPILRLRGGGF
jgi:hypothetical protein